MTNKPTWPFPKGSDEREKAINTTLHAEHKNPRFNIIQAEHNRPEFVVIDGQRLPSGAPAPGAKTLSVPMSRDKAIELADALEKEHQKDPALVDSVLASAARYAPIPSPVWLPMSDATTNADRANWAKDSLDLFAYKTGMDTAGEDDQTILTDLLTDLMHLADRDGLNWMDAIAHAVEAFNIEKREEK